MSLIEKTLGRWKPFELMLKTRRYTFGMAKTNGTAFLYSHCYSDPFAVDAGCNLWPGVFELYFWFEDRER